MQNSFRCAAALALMFVTYVAGAAERSAELADCAGIANGQQRLACYDALAARNGDALPPGASAPQQPAAVAAASPDGNGNDDNENDENGEDASYLADHWELDPRHKRGVFKFRPHRANYLIATYNSSPNNTPYRPFQALAPDAGDLSKAELAFQLGFKLKLAENVARSPVDLWFGYTQQNFWQAANHKASSPFRETDYQPELMAVMPVDFHFLGLRDRFINVGFVHQSNGQGSTLSRSWNRMYLQTGLERGDFSLLARVWKRVNEASIDDDNPDIIDYMGRGDLTASYRHNGHEFSALTRYNFHTDKGGLELGWAFPLESNLKGYVQFFSGYGRTLIDYNSYQRAIGVGVLVNFH